MGKLTLLGSESSSGAAPPYISPLLQPWYDLLSVKPGSALLSDLNILADGMNSDGDWGEADFISLTAAMETNEQRLRPLKTTSNDIMLTVGTVTLDADGAKSATGGILNTKWNPIDNGVKFTLNSAFMGHYGQTSGANPGGAAAVFGSSNIADDSACQLHRSGTTTTILNNLNSTINNYTTGANLTKSGLLNAVKRYFISIKRISNIQYTKYVNGNSATTNDNSFSLPDTDFAILAYASGSLGGSPQANTLDYARFSIAGSSLIDSGRVATRLNTFFAARGLSIANY